MEKNLSKRRKLQEEQNRIDQELNKLNQQKGMTKEEVDRKFYNWGESKIIEYLNKILNKKGLLKEKTINSIYKVIKEKDKWTDLGPVLETYKKLNLSEEEIKENLERRCYRDDGLIEFTRFLKGGRKLDTLAEKTKFFLEIYDLAEEYDNSLGCGGAFYKWPSNCTNCKTTAEVFSVIFGSDCPRVPFLWEVGERIVEMNMKIARYITKYENNEKRTEKEELKRLEEKIDAYSESCYGVYWGYEEIEEAIKEMEELLKNTSNKKISEQGVKILLRWNLSRELKEKIADSLAKLDYSKRPQILESIVWHIRKNGPDYLLSKFDYSVNKEIGEKMIKSLSKSFLYSHDHDYQIEYRLVVIKELKNSLEEAIKNKSELEKPVRCGDYIDYPYRNVMYYKEALTNNVVLNLKNLIKYPPTTEEKESLKDLVEFLEMNDIKIGDWKYKIRELP